ncbi:hypothetical protein K9N68_30910 [Kovacikia minuta CCNUW1]|uniref:hypothetical protein n=1 Tax=Kovacikia minuta TaxID=2931930 RepID=UPI001CCB0D73|nr:hypothetical protein [Kovacikia minuta]UBF25903.1 hypothetical protein K9N68_30910 [Kovacikia minuta CCNUW1]
MELLQQQPSEISLYKDSTRLVLQERTNIKWLFGILGFWAMIAALISSILVIEAAPIWIVLIVLGVTLVIEVITLLSWVINQTWYI